MSDADAIAFARTLTGADREEAIRASRASAENDPAVRTQAAVHALGLLLIAKGVITLDEFVSAANTSRANVIDEAIRTIFGDDT